MVRSIVSSIADRATRCPTWLERDGNRLVEVRGYSVAANLAFGILAATLILSLAAFILVSTP
ncbi:hypothetical protein [Devosia sediminis]|uniref:Uncharacterized protein n=1 Tax=Devosia sediminis TaxID=2798801 RepID=A0A934IW97_9HYPH|nr:hypothetical protein [Devosia sediminis]MBJ3783380.1 hypothetical protein [Devosia sediminis]